jgi:hypothetical protein
MIKKAKISRVRVPLINQLDGEKKLSINYVTSEEEEWVERICRIQYCRGYFVLEPFRMTET